DDSGLVEARTNRRSVEGELRRVARIALGRRQPGEEILPLPRGDRESDAAGLHQPATEAVPRELHEKVEELSAKTREPRGPGEIADVVAKGPEVSGVVGEPFEFESDSPDRVRVKRDLHAPERLHHRAVREGVTDGSVARDRFGDHQPPRGRRAKE